MDVTQDFKKAIKKAGDEVAASQFSVNKDTKQMLDTMQSANELSKSVKELPEEFDIEKEGLSQEELLDLFDRISKDMGIETKEETKEATGAGSAGGFSAPLFSKEKVNEEDTETPEEIQPQYNFNESVYIPEEKAIVAPYMIIDDTPDKYIVVLNIKEFKSRNLIWADNKINYKISVNKVKLPKSQIEILDSVEGKEGFNYIKIPYWLYKKLSNELSIKRITDENKRLKASNDSLSYMEYMDTLRDEHIIKYFEQIKGTGDDKHMQVLMKEDKLPGGVSDDMSIESVAKKHKVSIKKIKSEYNKGMKVELEHTDDKELASEITLDHLFELPDYYTKLSEMEGEGHKEETKEATTSSSSGSYVGTSFLAKNPKNWKGSKKTMYPGGNFVKVKGKCKTFPYCNQGDITALELFEREIVKEAIKNISKKYDIDKTYIKSVIIQKLYG